MSLLRPALVVTAIGVTILISYLAGGALDIGDSDRDEVFSLRDQAWLQSSRSALDTPFAIAWLPSSLVSRLSTEIALGRKSAIRDFAAAATAGACVLFVTMLLQSGAPPFPALLATLGMAFGATFWTRGVSWSLDALAPVWAITAVMASRRWLSTGAVVAAAAAAAAAILAIVEDPSWAAGLPAAALFIWKRRPTESRLGPAAILVVLVVVAATSFLTRLEFIRGAPWAALLHVDIPSVSSLWAMLSRGGWIPITVMASHEFTALGEVLVVAGFVILWNKTQDRVALGALVAGVVAVRYLTPQLQPHDAGAMVAIVGWAMVAIGLDWLGVTAPRVSPIVAGLVAVLLVAQPALTRVRMAAIHEADSWAVGQRMAAEVRKGDWPNDGLMIADTPKADASILLSAALSGSPMALVPQRADLVEAALGTDRPLLAFPSARSHLTSIGFLFERFFAANIALGRVVGRQACTPLTPNQWTDVSLQLDSAWFSLRSEVAAATPGAVSVYLAAPRPVTVTDRDRPLTPPEFTLLPADAGTEVRRRLEKATARGGGMRGWPITVINVSSSSAPTQAVFSLSEVPQAAMVVSTIEPVVTLCAASARLDFALDTSPRASSSARLISDGIFGVGWHGPEGGGDTFRWTASDESSIRAHVNQPGPTRVTVTAMPAAPDPSRPRLGLAVNACALPEQPLSPGLNDISWVVPANCWQTGANQLWLHSGPLVSPASLGHGGDTRQLGARVSGVRLDRIVE